MAKLKKNTYWLLLTAFLFLLGIVLCVGETTARYQNTALRNTVVQPAESGSIVSDCLVSGEQIILLGNMSVEEEGKTVEIRFASAASAIATLECICDSEYLSAELNTAELILDGGIATAELYVAPTDAAMSLEDNAEVDVLVEMYSETEGTVLSGTFRVTLIPIPRVTTTVTTAAQASPEVPAESTAATTTAATTTAETTTATAPVTTTVASTETTPAVTTATAATETTVTTPVEFLSFNLSHLRP